MRRTLLVLLSVLPLLTTPVRAETPTGPERRAILDVARGPAEAALRQPVRFLVRALNRTGDWAFLFAAMQRPDGKPVRYDGTPDAEIAREGLKSTGYAALLRRRDGGWHVVAEAVGPTDVPWEDWPARYGAPAAVFALP